MKELKFQPTGVVDRGADCYTKGIGFRIENVHMTSLRQHNSTNKFRLAKYCIFRFDVEEWKPRKAITFCQPKRVLLVNMNMLYSE